MYAIKNLSALNDKPVALKEQVFTRLFRIAEIAKLTVEEVKALDEKVIAQHGKCYNSLERQKFLAFDYENDRSAHIKEFQEILDNMKMAENQNDSYTMYRYKGISIIKKNTLLDTWEAIEKVLMDCGLVK